MFTGNEDHEITITEGGKMTRKYRSTIQPGEKLGGYFSQKALNDLLNQQGCVGIRYYYGIDSYGEHVLVLVGVDANENDLADISKNHLCMEMSIPCPNHCSTPNDLNQ
jgi:hypothetical protein